MSFNDLFNSSFLIFLGILVLVVSLLIVYFESKMREQNHKIASMLSLVSTLAEDMNGVKFGLNHLSFASIGGTNIHNNSKPLEESGLTLNLNKNDSLINVSDDDSDDDSDNNSDDSEESFDEVNNDSISDDSFDDLNDDSDNDDTVDDNNELQENDIKIFKLNISNQINNDIDDFDNINDIDENNDIENIDDLEELDDNLSLSHSESSELNDDTKTTTYDETIENVNNSLKVNNIIEENTKSNNLTSELKTININLEDSFSESLDFKKLPLQKLRSIVYEKGLSTDVSKLKKYDLLKLLGIE